MILGSTLNSAVDTVWMAPEATPTAGVFLMVNLA